MNSPFRPLDLTVPLDLACSELSQTRPTLEAFSAPYYTQALQGRDFFVTYFLPPLLDWMKKAETTLYFLREETATLSEENSGETIYSYTQQMLYILESLQEALEQPAFQEASIAALGPEKAGMFGLSFIHACSDAGLFSGETKEEWDAEGQRRFSSFFERLRAAGVPTSLPSTEA